MKYSNLLMLLIVMLAAGIAYLFDLSGILYLGAGMGGALLMALHDMLSDLDAARLVNRNRYLMNGRPNSGNAKGGNTNDNK